MENSLRHQVFTVFKSANNHFGFLSPNEKLFFSSIIAFAFFIPLSKFGTSLFSIGIMLFWILSPERNRRIRESKKSRFSTAVIIYLLLNVAGLLWTSHLDSGLQYVRKLSFLILIPVLTTSLGKRESNYILYSFIAGLLISVIISYVILFFDLNSLKQKAAFGPVPFIDHGSYSVLLTILISFIFILLLDREFDLRSKVILISFEIFLIVNLFLSGGRIGIVILLFLSIVIAFLYRKKFKWYASHIPASMILITLIFYFSMPGFNSRANLAYKGVTKATVENDYNSSWGGRLALQKVGLEIIKDHPLIGVGTGDAEFELKAKMCEAFPEFVTTGSLFKATDFHDQFIQDFVRLGLPGIISLLYIFITLFICKNKNVLFDKFKTILIVTYLLYGFSGIVLHAMIPLVTFVLLSSLLLGEEIEG
ncbi:MAG: O-antigen ligase family protein [Bacteroidetes bacterium]|nr:O-antigen ligase family protein [Bacteroidota bacterium]